MAMQRADAIDALCPVAFERYGRELRAVFHRQHAGRLHRHAESRAHETARGLHRRHFVLDAQFASALRGELTKLRDDRRTIVDEIEPEQIVEGERVRGARWMI